MKKVTRAFSVAEISAKIICMQDETPIQVGQANKTVVGAKIKTVEDAKRYLEPIDPSQAYIGVSWEEKTTVYGMPVDEFLAHAKVVTRAPSQTKREG